MPAHIIPLTCPTCGSGSHDGLRERTFGGEIKCKNCGVTSVLVIDNEWHPKKSGEYVCNTCGRIARGGDRFCECSKSLIRQCASCGNEFFAGRTVCPKCGWDHSLDFADEDTQCMLVKRLRTKDISLLYLSTDFCLLLESVTRCAKLTTDAEVYFRDLIIEAMANDCHYSNPLYRWTSESSSYNGFLFSEKKLSHLAVWMQTWHSKILKISSAIDRSKKESSAIYQKDEVDPEVYSGLGILGGIVAAIFAYNYNLITLTESIYLAIGLAIGLGVLGFVVGKLALVIDNYRRKSLEQWLQRHVAKLELELKSAKQYHH